jgi:hypothetical protein
MKAADFRRIALSFEGAEESSHMGAADFRVGGRIFATLASQKEGYGNLMLTPEQQAEFVRELPDVFLPIHGGWGRMGATHVRGPFVTFVLHIGHGTLFHLDLSRTDCSQMMDSLDHGFSWIALHWKSGAVVAGFVGIAATCRWCLETDEARAQRANRNRTKELRGLADRISTYGRTVHKRYPTGDVVVSECDLAEQLHKRPDAVATALDLLLGEQKVQRAPLNGYWKLRSRPTPEDSPRESFT